MNKERVNNSKKLTVSQVEEELKREVYKSKYTKILRSTIYALIIIAAIAAIVVTQIMPVLEINETSMKPTYENGDTVLSLKTKSLKSGDIVAFYHGNKILIKRVIAGSGSWINIDEVGNVYVNGEALSEDYISNKMLGEVDIEFPYQVPEGKYFVLSDDREILIDSRMSEIGCIDKDNIIGKVVFRVWPIKKNK